jgi:hypothetical protein
MFAWAEMIRARRMVATPFARTGLPCIDPADVAGAGRVRGCFPAVQQASW